MSGQDLRAVGAALWLASAVASLVIIVSIAGHFPRVWPGAILAFVGAFGAGLMLFVRHR